MQVLELYSFRKKLVSVHLYECCSYFFLVCFFVNHFHIICVLGYESLSPPRPAAIAAPVWQDRTIASSKLRLLEYSAFLETQKDRETVRPVTSLHELGTVYTLAHVTLLLPPCRINTFLYTLALQTLVSTTQCWNPSTWGRSMTSSLKRRGAWKSSTKKGRIMHSSSSSSGSVCTQSARNHTFLRKLVWKQDQSRCEVRVEIRRQLCSYNLVSPKGR